MSHCQECFTRFDACSECHAQEIAKWDAEIAALKDTITSLRIQIAVIGEYVKDKVNFVLEDTHV